jgi:RNA polymerase sigma-70 factor (ECF subfamily)
LENRNSGSHADSVAAERLFGYRSHMASTFEQAETRLSLLVRLTRSGPVDERAWREFVDYYAPVIYRWCVRRGLQDTDAQDVTQQVLLKLATKLPCFQYDPDKSFRAWLRTLTHHAWADFVTGRDDGASGHPATWAVLATAEAREDLLRRIEEEFDLELLEQAMAVVREKVEPATWEAFRLTALEGISGADAARRLGKQVATVYVLRSNVQKLLQGAIADLEVARRPGPAAAEG